MLFAVACSSGPRTGHVSGKVTFEGKPVSEGVVTFDTPGSSAEAKLKEDGTFVVEVPVVVGEYAVTVTPVMHLVDTDPGKSPPSPEYKEARNIPERYRQAGTSPLTAKVGEGKNFFELEMKKAP